MNQSLIVKQVKAFCESIDDEIAMFANVSALLNDAIDDINWIGFYFVKNGNLVLGPFQGKPACVYIKCGNGVCGTSLLKDEIIRVDNVHEFPGHIACDSRSNSEIVLPIHKNGEVYALLDVDSTSFSRFTNDDENTLIEVVKVIENYLN